MAFDDIRKKIAEDPETKDLILNDNDMYVVYQYLLQRDQKSLNDFLPKLILTPYVHISYVPTVEKVRQIENAVLKRHLETFESEIYISDADIDDFIISDVYQEKAVNYAKKFLEKPLKFQKGLYIYGPYGAGKSYLLSGLANELTKRKVNVVYVFVPDLIRTLKSNIGSDQLEKKINILKRCDVLILDDLGGENISVWFRDEILLPILHYRLNASLSVHISSNSNIAQLAKSMIMDKESDAIKVTRIIKRIEDLTKPFKFEKTFTKD